MNLKVVWSKEALRQLIEIEAYISKDSPERAKRFIDKLIDRGEEINNFPFQGRIVPEFSETAIREVIVKRYRIIYKISEKQIEILTVFEGHQILNRNKL